MSPVNPEAKRLRVETLLGGPGLAQYSGQSGQASGMRSIADAARKIESLGFDRLMTPETGHDPFLPLMIAAEHTESIGLGTAVAIAFPRSPMVVAQTSWDLQAFSGGRFFLGLGTQVKGHNERRYAAPWTAPAGPRMRDYLLAMKAMFHTFQTGAAPAFQGEHYTFTLMSPFFNPGPLDHPEVPIYISALNPYMARLSGEMCDGIRLHPLATPDFVRDVILPAIETGARKAGRSLSDVDVVASPFLITGKDAAEVEAAKAAVRTQIAFYASTRTYHAVLKHHGWEEVGLRLHEHSVAGRWPEMQNEVTDELLHAFATIGTYDELVPKLRKRWSALSDTIFLGMSAEMLAREDAVRELVDGLHAS